MQTLTLEIFETFDHGLHGFGGVTFPGFDDAGDAQGVLGAVALGGVPGEALVREVGVVFERAGGFHDVDVAFAFRFRLARKRDGELGAPDGGFHLGGEVDVLERPAATGLEVGLVTCGEQVAEGEAGLGAVVERAGDGVAVGGGDAETRRVESHQ